ncbi:MAG: hypothetical protein LBO62_03425, partial [Endomicrobium sp.]|nr:hypothetical protein [Endomicrobium sp.]
MFLCKNPAIFKVFALCAAAFLTVLLAEIFIFNYAAVFKPSFPVSVVDLKTAKGNPQDLVFLDNALHFNPQSQEVSLQFDDINIPTETITFEVSATFASVVRGKIYLQDTQFKQNFMETYNVLFAPNGKKQIVFAKIKSYGNLKSAAFKFNKMPGMPLTISAVKLNQAKPFNFSFLRFFLILSAV